MSQWKLPVDDLWCGEKSIGFFVHSERFFWVIDYKYNFTLDAGQDFRGYLNKGYITQEQYISACEAFRGGVLKLTADNFLKYLKAEETQVLSRKNINDLFMYRHAFDGVLHKKIEKYFLSGSELDANAFRQANVVASRLPMFYVNFDRKIYMHMDRSRMHEELVYPDWFSGFADFYYLIPDEEKYWILGGVDFWKYRFV